MMSRNRIIFLTTISALLLIGCAQQPAAHGPAFFNSHHGESVDRFAEAQRHAAIRHDPTLRAMHFEGDSLNILGRNRLDALAAMHDELVVYLDLQADEKTVEKRVDSVRSYLVMGDAPVDSLKVKIGPAPATSAAATDGVEAMERRRTEPTSENKLTFTGK